MTIFAQPTVEPKRDRYGRYLISGADGGPAKAHTRATTFAKAVAEEGALTGWKMRMVALGLAARTDLYAGVAAVTDSDTPDGKKKLNAICEDALEAGGGTTGRNMGTAVHEVIEGINRGADPTGVAPMFRADVDAYTGALRSAGVAVYPGMVERVIVNSTVTVAGTFDLLVQVPGYDLPLVADLKTGSSVAYGAGEWAIQLALYAGATSLYNYSTDTHEAFPAVDPDHGLIIHLPAGTGACQLHIIDLAAGRRMIDVCATVRAWRNESKRLLTPLAAPAATIPATAPEGQATTGAAPDPAPSPVLAPIPSPVRDAGPIETAAVDDRVRHLHGRLSALQAVNPAAITEVLNRWPADTCSLSAHLAGDGTLVPWQLDQIETATSAVEAAIEAPFYTEVDPTVRGLDFDDDAIQDTIAAIKALPEDLRAQVQVAARDTGVPKFTERPTAAQLDQVIALVASAEASWADRCQLATTSIAYTAELAGVPTPAVLDAAGCTFSALDDRWAILARDVEVLSDLGDAVALGIIGPSVDGVTLVVALDAVDTLATRYGGKRPLLTAARAAAKTLGLDVPSKATDVAASIPLVAHLAIADIPVDDAAPTN